MVPTPIILYNLLSPRRTKPPLSFVNSQMVFYCLIDVSPFTSFLYLIQIQLSYKYPNFSHPSLTSHLMFTIYPFTITNIFLDHKDIRWFKTIFLSISFNKHKHSILIRLFTRFKLKWSIIAFGLLLYLWIELSNVIVLFIVITSNGLCKPSFTSL